MAGPTTAVAKAIIPYWTGGTLAHQFLHGNEHAASTFKNGACLIDDGAGLLTESTSPLSAANHVLGIAGAPASGVTSADIVYVPVLADFLWEATLSTVSSAHTLAAADFGTIVTVSKDTVSGRWYLDTGTTVTTNLGFEVLMFRDPVGTVDGRVIGRFLSGIIGTSGSTAPTGVALAVYA